MFSDWKSKDVAPLALGATLQSVTLSQDKTTVTLETDKGTLTLTSEGDCCSHSWFESCEGEDAIGGQITEFDDGTQTDLGEVEKYEYVVCYFPVIKTTKGRVIMEMRNSSNGYYGGYIIASWKVK